MTINAIRAALDHWLGSPTWKQKQGRVTLFYQFMTEALPQLPFNVDQAIIAFKLYMENENRKITRAQFEANLAEKFSDSDFGKDIKLMMTPEIQWYKNEAEVRIVNEVIALLPGEKWKGKV